MALNSGYPYTGGIYGGYSDPENNKKKPFLCPDADKAVQSGVGALASGVKQGYGNYRTGVQETLDKTSEAYKKGGVGAAAGQYVRGTVGDAMNALKQGVGKPAMNTVVKPVNNLARGAFGLAENAAKGTANFGRTLLTGDSTPVFGDQSKPAQQSPQAGPKNNFAGNLPSKTYGSGSRYDFDMRSGLAGNRMQPSDAPGQNFIQRQPEKGMPQPESGMTQKQQSPAVTNLSQGIPGQNGYGKISLTGNLPKPGSTTLNRGVPGRPNATPTAVNVLAQLGDATGTARQGGLEFQGKASDAAKFFAGAPAGSGSGYDSNEYKAQQYRKANPFDTNNPYDSRFSYKPAPVNPLAMIAPPPLATGSGGWKSQKAANQANAAAYGDYTRAMASLAANQNSANTDRYRTDMNYLSGQQQNDLARQRLGLDARRYGGQAALNNMSMQREEFGLQQAKYLDDLMKQAAAEKNQEKKQALLNEIAMIRHDKPVKPVYQTVKENDLVGGQRERVYRMNPDGTMSEVMPTISQADITRQQFFLQGLKGVERKKYLEELARYNPAMFDALLDAHKQRRK